MTIARRYGDVNSLLEPTTTAYPFDADIDQLRMRIEDALRIPLVSSLLFDLQLHGNALQVPFDPVVLKKSTESVFIAASRSQLGQLRNVLPRDSPHPHEPFLWIDTYAYADSSCYDGLESLLETRPGFCPSISTDQLPTRQ